MKQRPPRTRLDAFLLGSPFSIATFARRAEVGVEYLRYLRAGKIQPKLDTIERLRRTASALAGREVDVCEMFELGER
jgi:predicted transcriptional regulator